MQRRWTAILVAAFVTIGIAGAAGAVQSTQAAWNDRTYASAAVTAGSWSTAAATGCVAMNADGTPKTNGYCTVASIVMDAEWGAIGSRTRNYRVYLDSNAGNGYIQLTIDLSAGSSPFSWSSAGLMSPNGTAQLVPNNGWTCAQLPILTGKTPTNWGWAAGSSIFFQITENRASTSVVCS